jgi:hypothetical protein
MESTPPVTEQPIQSEALPTETQTATAATPSNIQKNNTKVVFTSVIVVLLLAVVGAGAYYLGVSQSNTPPSMPLPPNGETGCTLEALMCPDGSSVGRSGPNCEFAECPSTEESSTETEWLEKTVEVQKETDVSGKETLLLSFSSPSDWNYKTAIKRPNSDYKQNDCLDYQLINENSGITVTIRPICSGWSATYSDWPNDAVTIRERNNVGQDSHTAYTVRYFDSLFDEYDYVDGEKGETNQIMDAMLIPYGNGSKFLPVYVKVSSGSNKNISWEIPDKIIKSIKIN